MGKIEAMLDLKALIDNATVEYEAIKKELMEDMGDENIQIDHNWSKFNIIKVRKLTFALKAWVDQAKILDDYPLAAKTSIDLDVLKKTPSAHNLFEPKETTYITIRALKDNDNDGFY